VLNIKPLISIKQGEIKTAGKSMGLKRAHQELLNLTKTGGGIDFLKPFAIGYTGGQEHINGFKQICSGHMGDDIPTSSIGAVIGTHAGPGAVAIAFFKNSI
jgi:fatty acid-binding protein DegV